MTVILAQKSPRRADREQAARNMGAYPDITRSAQANRAFLGSMVRWYLARGVDQFLDLGSGVPTAGNVHEIDHGIDPAARVAYVDFEPVAVAHAQEITADLPSVTVTRADIRDPDSMLGAPGVVDLSHNSDDQDDPELAAALAGVAEAMRGSAAELTLRSRAELSASVSGLDLVPPGLVDLAEWPDPGGVPTGGRLRDRRDRAGVTGS
ncbi:MAG TPA: SAM-dependent methyltransferase [Actinomycetospora sp.]|jgi:hypothetical protein|uniref:SAM-dependent methyltransferase n=1 Tax=Actinomycetospora sp. TaxID=1872135 RepID=UPI002F3F3077